MRPFPMKKVKLQFIFLPHVILSEVARSAAKSKNLILSILFSSNWVKDPSTPLRIFNV